MAGQNKAARWSKTVVTDAGTELLTEFAAGRSLHITSAFGSGSGPGGDLVGLEELPDGRKHPLTIESVVKSGNVITLCLQVTSLGNPEPYKLEQIGIFAAAGGDGLEAPSGHERLLMVIEDIEDERGGKGVTVPAETDQLYTFKLYAVLTVSNQDRLEVSVSSAGIATIGAIYAALEQHGGDLDAHPGLTARLRVLEMALNGSVTILQAGGPTDKTEGTEGQRCIDPVSGEEFVCVKVTEKGYIWEPANESGAEPLRETLEKALAEHDANVDAHGPIRAKIDSLIAENMIQESRLSLLELMYNTDVSGNPFTVTFESLTGLICTGVWNTALARLEF